MVEVESEQDAIKVANRCVLLRYVHFIQYQLFSAVYDVWGTGDMYPELVQSLQSFIDNNKEYTDPFLAENTTFKLDIVSYGKRRTQKQEFIDHFMNIPWRGKVDLANPQYHFHALEAFTLP